MRSMDDARRAPAPLDELDQATFESIYGRVTPWSPADALRVLGDAPFRWWVAGGWSTELDAEPRRHHDDLEIAIPRRDLPALRGWLQAYHLWSTFDRGIRYLAPDDALPDDHDQLWLRRDATSPWLADLMLTPVDGDTWQYKRDRSLKRPLDDVIRVRPDGVPVQRPEITLLFKARRLAPRDGLDFLAVAPRLDEVDRHWLRVAIARTESPEHPWVAALDDGAAAQPGVMTRDPTIDGRPRT